MAEEKITVPAEEVKTILSKVEEEKKKKTWLIVGGIAAVAVVLFWPKIKRIFR